MAREEVAEEEGEINCKAQYGWLRTYFHIQTKNWLLLSSIFLCLYSLSTCALEPKCASEPNTEIAISLSPGLYLPLSNPL